MTARVFRQKFTALMDELVKGSLFGVVVAHLATIEFQKRGLPHAHILLIVQESDRLTTPEQIDSVICAELPPDPETGATEEEREQMRRLEIIVLTNMVHGPCGTIRPSSPCMEDGKCDKNFPKAYQKHTVIDAASHFPTYRRRSPEDGGRVISVQRGGVTFEVTNANVVPYNPYLSLRFNCHINVEKSNSARNTKYLYKYVLKGPDRAMVSVEADGDERPRDEIADFKDLRSVGASEASYLLYGFPLAQRHPPVTVLRVHEKDEQHVVFDEGSEEMALEQQRETELTAFFKLNDKNEEKEEGERDEVLPGLRYVDMPQKYTYNKKEKKWDKRSDKRKCDVVGRIDNIHPSAGDRFYLRMLLNSNHCKGKTSFEELKSVDGSERGSWKEVCQRLGMLQDDREWEMVLEEAASTRSCANQVGLFVTIALFNNPADPKALFEQFWLQWTDQIVMKARERNGVELCNEPCSDDDTEVSRARKVADQALLKTLVLLELKRQLHASDKGLADVNLQEPTEEEEAAVAHITGGVSVILRDELDFSVPEAATRASEAEARFTDEQAAIYNTLVEAVRAGKSRQVFIQAAGGCGKTMLINAVLDKVRSMEAGGCVALATATTGKAAMHLSKGRTFHSRFKAPLNLGEDCSLRIPLGSELAKLVWMAKLIVVDEATMLNNVLLQALDACFRDIMDTQVPFGGKVLVLCGDFRQTLPVIPGASRAGIVNKCLNQHPLWRHFEVMYLTKNMRVNANSDPKLVAWGEWLQSVGDGIEGEEVKVPEEICTHIEVDTKKKPMAEKDSLKGLIEKVFPNLKGNLADLEWLTGRSILTPTNKQRHRINEAMVEMAPGQEVKLRSADVVDNVQDAVSFSVEYCNSLEPTGLPKHEITLKPGVPVMLMRNLNPSAGLCNGTRLIFSHVAPNKRVIYCMQKDEVSGRYSMVAIPRICLRPKEKEYPFEWSRLQFPIEVAFVTTINKAQGDSLKMIGIWLPAPVFGHGQFYVALSRVGAPERCVVALKPGEVGNSTRNVVFQEVLEGVQPPKAAEVEVEAGPTQQVEDITQWLDYDAVEVEMEETFNEEMMEEAGADDQEETRRRVDARRRLPTTVGRQPRRRSDDIEKASTASVPEYEPSCEYECIRDQIRADKERMYETIFGVPYPRGQQSGLLEQILYQPDLGEEEEVGASGDNGEEEVMGEGASGDNSGEEQ